MMICLTERQYLFPLSFAAFVLSLSLGTALTVHQSDVQRNHKLNSPSTLCTTTEDVNLVQVDGVEIMKPLFPGRFSNPQHKRRKISIRKMNDADVDTVSTLLAEVVNSTPRRTSWMHRLRVRASFSTQLKERLAAIDEAHSFFSRERSSKVSGNTQSYLWREERFRSKLRSAARSSVEDHAWVSNDLHVLPEDHASLLQHVMFTAVDKLTDEVAGFIEVAMLPVPQGDAAADVAVNRQEYGPVIFNLVTAEAYRRKGIASRLINTSRRYVRKHWTLSKKESTKLGLYVDDDNLEALGLYYKEGFLPANSPFSNTEKLGDASQRKSYLARCLWDASKSPLSPLAQTREGRMNKVAKSEDTKTKVASSLLVTV